MVDESKETSLGIRTGLPQSLKFLLDSYPRDIWINHQNMGALTRFWLSRHDEFRKVIKAINEHNGAFLEGNITPQLFSSSIVPTLSMFVNALSQHHSIEDHHYFPKFLAVEPKLARGFEILDKDHHALHDALDFMVLKANNLIRAEGQDEVLSESEGLVEANQKLLAFLHRHLEDEEDIVVPLMLDRGEGFE